MADSLTDVKPGDLITAEMWNNLMTRLTTAEAKLTQLSVTMSLGNIIVPDLFGRKLSDAKAILADPSHQLILGIVLDALGNLINTNLSASGKLLVLNQLPAPGTRTTLGSSVSLVVAASGVTSAVTETVQPKPPIVKSVTPSPAPVGTQVTVLGANFVDPPDQNVVTIGGKATTKPTNQSSTTMLFVKVPTDISGAPVKPTDAVLKDVKVVVKNDNGTGEGKCDVGPPPAKPKAEITSIIPEGGTVGDVGVVGKSVIIKGTNLGAQPGDNEVSFDGVPAPVVSAKPEGTEIKATVPTGIDGVLPGKIRENVPVTVKVKGQEAASDAALIAIFMKGQ